MTAFKLGKGKGPGLHVIVVHYWNTKSQNPGSRIFFSEPFGQCTWSLANYYLYRVAQWRHQHSLALRLAKLHVHCPKGSGKNNSPPGQNLIGFETLHDWSIIKWGLGWHHVCHILNLFWVVFGSEKNLCWDNSTLLTIRISLTIFISMHW